MNSIPKPLASLQQWMQTVITHPGGVVAGAASTAEHPTEDHGLDSVNEKILPNRALTSVQRLEIYHHAYYARLFECLREYFPALTHAIGDDLFDEFAFGYLQKYPPQSYTLNRLADCFVQFLQETKPGDTTFEGAGWADFLIDLARLEWTIEEVFDGEGNENGATLSAESLKAIPLHQWPTSRLILNPSLRLLAFRFPVNDYYTTFRHGGAAEFPAARETWVAIHRREFIVRRNELTLAQYQLLQAIRDGAPLGEAIERAADAVTVDFVEWVREVQNSFQTWAVEQVITSVNGSFGD